MGAVMNTIGATGTSLSSTPTAPVTVIHDQVIGTPRWIVWQDRQREQARTADFSVSVVGSRGSA
jgi:hypothetical protein